MGLPAPHQKCRGIIGRADSQDATLEMPVPIRRRHRPVEQQAAEPDVTENPDRHIQVGRLVRDIGTMAEYAALQPADRAATAMPPARRMRSRRYRPPE